MLDTLARDFRASAPAADFCALRFMEESSEFLTVRQDVAEPPQLSTDRGVMITVMMHCWINGIMGESIRMNADFSRINRLPGLSGDG